MKEIITAERLDICCIQETEIPVYEKAWNKTKTLPMETLKFLWFLTGRHTNEFLKL